MEPLGGLDAAFLAMETRTIRMHVAAVVLLDPPEGRRSLFSPSTRYAQLRRLIERRLHLVPRLRQRAQRVPLGLQRPVWVDDPEFELDDHLARASLPDPGGRCELESLIADVMSRPLDPDRPLWEMVVVEGLADGRMALVAKIHHAVLDGISGASALAHFFDLQRRERVVALPPTWEPEPPPSSADMVRYTMGSLARQPGAVLEAVRQGAAAVADVGAQNRVLEARGVEPPPAPFSAPRTSLNGAISSRRRFASVSVPMEDLKLVRRTFGGTVNDVVLGAVSGALRRLLEHRGQLPAEPLVALVPVSGRRRSLHAERLVLGNQVSGMLVSLASDVDDPIERLQTISGAVRVARAQERLVDGQLFEGMAQVVTPVLVARVIRWATDSGFVHRFPPLYNVTVSNVPGPPVPLWSAGSKVSEIVPVGPVAEGAGLNITAMSYLGTMQFGLLGCRRLVPDVEDLALLLDDAVGELVAASLDARAATG